MMLMFLLFVMLIMKNNVVIVNYDHDVILYFVSASQRTKVNIFWETTSRQHGSQ